MGRKMVRCNEDEGKELWGQVWNPIFHMIGELVFFNAPRFIESWDDFAYLHVHIYLIIIKSLLAYIIIWFCPVIIWCAL